MEKLPVRIQVLIVADQALVREGIAAILKESGECAVVGKAHDPAAAAEMLVMSTPHVGVLGLGLPREERVRAIAMLARLAPSMRLLVLIGPEDIGASGEFMAAGAIGVLELGASAEMITYTVRSAAEGLADAPMPVRLGDPDGLSAREGEVARLIVRGHGNKDIAAQLQLSVKTVETYKARLMQKLGVATRAALVDRALRRGWLMTQ